MQICYRIDIYTLYVTQMGYGIYVTPKKDRCSKHKYYLRIIIFVGYSQTYAQEDNNMKSHYTWNSSICDPILRRC